MKTRPSIRELEYVLAIEREGTFRDAAEACHVTQPALSAGIAGLEERLGVALFERTRPRVRPTLAGRRLATAARELLPRLDDAVGSACEAGAPFAAPFRLGVIPTIAPYLLPGLLTGIRAEAPGAVLEIIEGRTADLVGECEDGGLDAALLAREADLHDLAVEPLGFDAFLLAVAKGHRLAKRRRVGEADLDGLDVLVLEEGHCLRDQALDVCRRAGVSSFGDVRATSLATLVELVGADMGATLVPAMALRSTLDGSRIVAVPFRDPQPGRTIALAFRPTSARTVERAAIANVLRRVPVVSKLPRGRAKRAARE